MVKIKKQSKKYVLLGLCLLLVATAAGALYVSQQNNNKKSGSDTSAPGVPYEQSGAAAIKSSEGSGPNQNADPPKATEIIQSASLNIDNFSQANGLVKASAIVSNPSSSTGDCYFGFASEGTKPVSRSVPSTGDGAASQKCSVEINEVEFTKLGMWKLTVIFTQNNAKIEKSQDVTIN